MTPNSWILPYPDNSSTEAFSSQGLLDQDYSLGFSLTRRLTGYVAISLKKLCDVLTGECLAKLRGRHLRHDFERCEEVQIQSLTDIHRLSLEQDDYDLILSQ
jgi:hypothetical protein